jgi:hypothetical protein
VRDKAVLEGDGTLSPMAARRGERSPDMRGCFRLNGVVYTISAWRTVSGPGTYFLKLKIGRDASRDREPVTP